MDTRSDLDPTQPTEFGTITFRLLLPSDQPALQGLFHNLSSKSRYQRFHGHVSDLSTESWRYLSEVDEVDHVAIGAFAPARQGERHRLVGVARFIRSERDPRRAELAVTVLDDLQRRGLGTHLLDLLLRVAAHRGVDELVAPILDDNLGMKRLLAHFGPTRSSSEGQLLSTRRVPVGFTLLNQGATGRAGGSSAKGWREAG